MAFTTYLFTTVLVLASVASYASERVFGEPREDQALVYLLQGKGSKRYVFANDHWLGTVNEDSYTFSHVEPGEYLIWTDKADYEWAFLSSAETYYFEVTKRSTTALDEGTGKTKLETVASYQAVTDRDRRQSAKKVWKYGWVRRRAAASGMYEPCRFSKEKRTEYMKRGAISEGFSENRC